MDYNLRFMEHNANNLLNNWALYSKRLNEMLTTVYNSHIYTQWSKDIQDILILLKLLPAKMDTKKVATLESFNKAIEKTISFSKGKYFRSGPMIQVCLTYYIYPYSHFT